MELGLEVRQKQILSQNMQLSLKILQMNALDLEHYIQECALENPLIEIEASVEDEDSAPVLFEKLDRLYSLKDEGSYHNASKDDDDFETPLYENKTTDSLTDVLTEQLSGFRLNEETERRVRCIIESLDENGYISLSREQLLKAMMIGNELLDEALSVLHRMEPYGVGAFDLKDCLLIQARKNPYASEVLLSLIENHLEALGKNQLFNIAQKMNVSIEEVKRARDELTALNPKPGNGYSQRSAIPYICPDLFVTRTENRFSVVINETYQPKISISGFYRDLIKNGDAEAARYICERLRKAEWLISCIQQRRNTVLKCAVSILNRQTDFFERGPGNLNCMTLADVASDLSVHPSTVSRAIREKYMQSQWGVFALSDLFTNNVGYTDCAFEEGRQSQDMVMTRIKSIIAGENLYAPLSDQEIVNALKKHNVNIARRTVAKYRTQLKIPPHAERKIF